LHHRTTRQTFFGAADLDTPPAENGKAVQAGRVWCQQGTAIEAGLKPEPANLGTGAELSMELLDPDKKVVATGASNKPIRETANHSGWFSFAVKGAGLPGGKTAYELTVEYTGTQNFKP
jgi:hypothetical protein